MLLKTEKIVESGIKIDLNIKTDKPQGRITFKNARIITM